MEFMFTVLPASPPTHMPVVHFNRNGAFHVEPPPPKPRIERQRREPTKEAKRIMPTEVNTSSSSYCYKDIVTKHIE